MRIALLLAVPLLQCLAAVAQTPIGTAPTLFEAEPMKLDPDVGHSAKIVRGTPITVDLGLLYAGRVGDIVRFPAFDGRSFDLRLDRREEIAAVPGAFHWHTSLVGDPDGRCTLTVVGNSISAHLVPGDMPVSTIVVQPSRVGPCLREIQPSHQPCPLEEPTLLGTRSLRPPKPSPPITPLGSGAGGGGSIAGSSPCVDDPTLIQVLLVYDDHALNEAGGQMQMMAYTSSCGWGSYCTLQYARFCSNPGKTISTPHAGTVVCGDTDHNNQAAILNSRQYIANWGLMVSPLWHTPRITVRPSPRAVCLGPQIDPYMMSVTATNAQSYQWQFRQGSSWVDLVGQTTRELIMSAVTAQGRSFDSQPTRRTPPTHRSCLVCARSRRRPPTTATS